MYNLADKEIKVLEEIETVTNGNVTIFGYFEKRINEDDEVFSILRKLDNDGYIKVEWLDDYPLYIKINNNGKSVLNVDENKEKRNSEALYRVGCFVLGIIVGILIMLIKSSM